MGTSTQSKIIFTDNELRHIALNAMGRASEVHSLSIKKKLVFGSLLFLVSFGYAQNTKKCSGIERDRERGQCVHAQYKKADIELNKAYTALRDFFNSENQDILKKTQLVWLNYRDLDCNQVANRYSGGTLFDEILDQCLMEKTKSRTKELIYLKELWEEVL